VEQELVVFQDLTLPARAVEGLCPVAWSYDLVRSLLRGRPEIVLPTSKTSGSALIGTITPDEFAVDPAYIGGPAIVVRVEQAATPTWPKFSC
jgi:hypothetical protein